MFALLRWFAVVIGGALIGIGITLHGQVALAYYMREEVDKTFVLWRAIGRATFYFQGAETRMALAMKEVPPEALRQSDRAAWVIVSVGVIVAVCGSLIRRHKVVAAKPARARGSARG